MKLLILLLPLFASLLAATERKRTSSLIPVISSCAILFSFLISLYFSISVLNNNDNSIRFFAGDWIVLDNLNLSFSFLLDELSAIMVLLVTGVGSLIHFYSISYMAGDPGRNKFFSYLNLFIFFMLVLVLGEQLPVIFIGWEGVGLCSYLLIGFWFKKIEFAECGKKAFIFNRIGDAGFLLGMFCLYHSFGTLNVSEIGDFVTKGSYDYFWLSLAGFSLFFAATGKSAQIPLFNWLPDAMAGPTPVSALIHAATMVTAGVYLMVRTFFIYENIPFLREFIFYIAFATAIIAAIIALFQNDLKKILAYSTVSQLGFMFMAIGSGAYIVAIFHVLTHAFFKACLFLSAGNIIHACHGEQDINKMGGLKEKLPLTFVSYLIATLAIVGFYPFSGYFSKYLIVDLALDLTLGIKIISVLTVIYMTRSLVRVFLGEYRGNVKDFHKMPILMNLPVLLLALLSLFGGYLLNMIIFKILYDFSGSGDPVLFGGHKLIKGFIFIAVPALLTWFFLSSQSKLLKIIDPLFYIFRKKFFLDEIYESLISKPLYFISGLLEKVMEHSIFDLGVASSGSLALVTGQILKFIQNGQVRLYASFLFFFSFALIFICIVL